MNKDPLASLDLLQTLNSNNNSFPLNPKPIQADNNMDLTLTLSLNGKHGLNPERYDDRHGSNKNKLSPACSSSVDFEFSLNSGNIQLSRSCSLVDEDEWKKRKEMQMLRRSEVKRRRLDQKMKKKKKGLVRLTSDGSSQGSGSSGVSDLDTLPSSGTDRDTGGTNEPSYTNKVQGNLKIATNEPAKTNKVQGNPKITPTATKANKVQGDPKITPNVHSVIDQTMPCVSTKEEGPDGKRIQGFLYRYGKGEEVRIVCVCHGSFLTPAEFVKHGGGGDVEHPLRHIIVTPLLS